MLWVGCLSAMLILKTMLFWDEVIEDLRDEEVGVGGLGEEDRFELVGPEGALGGLELVEFI